MGSSNSLPQNGSGETRFDASWYVLRMQSTGGKQKYQSFYSLMKLYAKDAQPEDFKSIKYEPEDPIRRDDLEYYVPQLV